LCHSEEHFAFSVILSIAKNLTSLSVNSATEESPLRINSAKNLTAFKCRDRSSDLSEDGGAVDKPEGLSLLNVVATL